MNHYLVAACNLERGRLALLQWRSAGISGYFCNPTAAVRRRRSTKQVALHSRRRDHAAEPLSTARSPPAARPATALPPYWAISAAQRLCTLLRVLMAAR